MKTKQKNLEIINSERKKNSRKRRRKLKKRFLTKIQTVLSGCSKERMFHISDPTNSNLLNSEFSPFQGYIEKQHFNIKHVQKSCENTILRSLITTIDLCTNDMSLENSSCVNNSPVNTGDSESAEVIVDMCKITPVDDEIMIVKENTIPKPTSNEIRHNSKTTIIDLIEDDKAEKNTDTNDDVLVIGTYSKMPLKSASSLNGMMKYWEKRSRKANKYKFKKNLELKLDMFNNAYPDTIQSQRKENLLVQSDTYNAIGKNIYLNSPRGLPRSGLRPIVIDGSNVAISRKGGFHFSCKKLEICIKYFKERGHKVTAFVPQFRILHNKSDNPQLLKKLVENGDVILTPSKCVEGKCIVPYDDRFIVQTAALKGGIIVTRDNYKDLLVENPAWAETINYRTLPYTWVDDVLMFPNDPLGEHGPTLDEFLRFH